MELKDRNGRIIEVGSKLKDSQGEYVVRLGSFERKDNDEYIAYGNNGINKLLSPKRSLEFELIDSP